MFIIMWECIRLLRPHQWLKNCFVFLPLFFGGKLLQLECFFAAMWAFLSFSFVASSIYCLNDLIDVEADRCHPLKCKRPIASGMVSSSVAIMLMAICLVAATCACLMLGSEVRRGVMLVEVSYFVINIAYCLKLKQKAVIDVFVISLGFVMRICVGGIATNVTPSQWIVLMTFLLALFLTFAKRRDDVVVYEHTRVLPRKNICRYNLPFMNQVIGILSAITIVCYIMYTVSPEVVERFDSQYVYVTSVFVIAGIVRYLQLTIVDAKSGSPTKVLIHDSFIQLCLLLWIASFVVIIYI